MTQQTQTSPPLAPPAPRRRRATTLVAALIAVSAASAWLGARSYDPAVTTPHPAPVAWALRQGVELAVRRRAADVSIPAGVQLQDRQLAERAIGHYSVACAPCHAAPGQPAAPWMVLYPPAADLTQDDTVSRWSDAELYWIIKNGIKDTAMIALGPTHAEHDLWAVAAFVRQLPALTPERYQELVTRYQAQRAATATSHGH